MLCGSMGVWTCGRVFPQARHVALPRDAEADGAAVVDVLAAAEQPGRPWDIFVGKNV